MEIIVYDSSNNTGTDVVMIFVGNSNQEQVDGWITLWIPPILIIVALVAMVLFIIAFAYLIYRNKWRMDK